MDEFFNEPPRDGPYQPKRRSLLPVLLFLLVFLLSFSLFLRWLTYTSPLELYHQAWQEVSYNLYDQQKLVEWQKWEHKFDQQIKTREDAIARLNEACDAVLQDGYTRMGDLSLMPRVPTGFTISTGVEINYKLNKEGRPETDAIGRFLPVAAPDGYALITKVASGSQAELEGLQPGDAVLSIDGKSTQDKDARELMMLLSGVGKFAELRVRTAGGEKTVSLERKQVPQPNVSSKILPGNVGYITWESFDRPQVAAVEKELDKLQACDALVVDMRNNGGGEEVAAILSTQLFLESGIIAFVDERIRGAGFESTAFSLKPDKMVIARSVDGKQPVISEHTRLKCKFSRPMVVLVNGMTASAGEFFSGALKDNGAAVVMGTRTLGKGVGYGVRRMPRDTYLSVVSLRYYTPNGHFPGDGNPAHSPGIEPDLQVTPVDGLEIGGANDNQLKEALDLIARLLAPDPE